MKPRLRPMIAYLLLFQLFTISGVADESKTSPGIEDLVRADKSTMQKLRHAPASWKVKSRLPNALVVEIKVVRDADRQAWTFSEVVDGRAQAMCRLAGTGRPVAASSSDFFERLTAGAASAFAVAADRVAAPQIYSWKIWKRRSARLLQAVFWKNDSRSEQRSDPHPDLGVELINRRDWPGKRRQRDLVGKGRVVKDLDEIRRVFPEKFQTEK
jgi:hypothetical protein